METDEQLSPPLSSPSPLTPPVLPALPSPPVLIPMNPIVQGDPATRTFGYFFLGTLAIITIGVAIGIGVGNIAHYRYFGPADQALITNISDLNQTFFRAVRSAIDTPQLFPLNEYLTKESSPKTREFWLSMNKPSDDNHDRP